MEIWSNCKKTEIPLISVSSGVYPESIEKPLIKKLKFITPSIILVLSNIADATIEGIGLLNKNNENSYEGVYTSQVNIKTNNKSTKAFISMFKSQSIDKTQNKIRKIC